jgi:hypothetical protein
LQIAILSTLIACLPSESKDLLCAEKLLQRLVQSFHCLIIHYLQKILQIRKFNLMIQHVLEKIQSIITLHTVV